MNRTTIFTDGAAKGNPGPGGWGAIIVTPDERVTELGGGSPHTTNNKMELSGAIAALETIANAPGPVRIYTDSTYLIQGITQWVWGWRKKGWRTATGGEVLNRDLWERLFALTSARGANCIEWHWVRGHVGTAGNERCDEIAVAFAVRQPPNLYDGPLRNYQIDVLTVPDETSLPKRSASSAGNGATKAKAYSYLSFVDGVPMRHATWAECELRVKGRSGARYKKATSAADELAVLRDWGVSL
ncbi:MAG TPA: ribonuclease HI [Vicinamibacterales bacterium]